MRTKIGNEEILLGALYLSRRNLIDQQDFENLIKLAPNKEFIFGGGLSIKLKYSHSSLTTVKDRALTSPALQNNSAITWLSSYA